MMEHQSVERPARHQPDSASAAFAGRQLTPATPTANEPPSAQPTTPRDFADPSLHISIVTRLALARLWKWIDSQWHPSLQAFARSRFSSYEDLVFGTDELTLLFQKITLLDQDLEMSRSVDDILIRVRSAFIRFLLEQDMSPWEDELLYLLQRRIRHGREALDSLSGTEFFYFWFCEARQAISSRPNLPTAVGALFDHSESRVQDYIQAVHRKIRAS
jgi:hypothetical protein